MFDTLAQIHLMRGDYDRASEYLRQAGEAYGAQGPQAARWYEWSVKVLEVKIATRRGAYEEAVALADELSRAADIPPTDAIQADLAACEALLAAGRPEEARTALERDRSPVRSAVGPGELGRVPARARHGARQPGRARHRVPRLRAERDRLRSAGRALSDAPPAIWRWRSWRPAPARRAPRCAAWTSPGRCSRRSAPRPTRPTCARSARPSTAAAQPVPSRSCTTPKTRSCAGWWTPRCCRSCWRASSRPWPPSCPTRCGAVVARAARQRRPARGGDGRPRCRARAVAVARAGATAAPSTAAACW